MIFVLASQFHVYLPFLGTHLAKCLNIVLNVKALEGAFNQEKALVGAFFVIVKSSRTLFEALLQVRMQVRRFPGH